MNRAADSPRRRLAARLRYLIGLEDFLRGEQGVVIVAHCPIRVKVKTSAAAGRFV